MDYWILKDLIGLGFAIIALALFAYNIRLSHKFELALFKIYLNEMSKPEVITQMSTFGFKYIGESEGELIFKKVNSHIRFLITFSAVLMALAVVVSKLTFFNLKETIIGSGYIFISGLVLFYIPMCLIERRRTYCLSITNKHLRIKK